MIREKTCQVFKSWKVSALGLSEEVFGTDNNVVSRSKGHFSLFFLQFVA